MVIDKSNKSIFETQVLFKDTKGYNLFQIDAH